MVIHLDPHFFEVVEGAPTGGMRKPVLVLDWQRDSRTGAMSRVKSVAAVRVIGARKSTCSA